MSAVTAFGCGGVTASTSTAVLEQYDQSRSAVSSRHRFVLKRRLAPLARIEGHIAFDTIRRRILKLVLGAGPLTWRNNQCLRGLVALPVTFS
jgi:hypothetical protein